MRLELNLLNINIIFNLKLCVYGFFSYILLLLFYLYSMKEFLLCISNETYFLII